MGKRTIGIVVIMGGIGVIYLAASGGFDSFWRGVTGNCCGCKADVSEEDGTNTGGHATRGQFYPGLSGALFVSDSGIYG